MQITVDVNEERVADLVRQRLDELFSDDARYRDSGVRDQIRRLVDDAALGAVMAARDHIAGELPAMANAAVRREITDEMQRAAKRGLAMLRKLYAGFDPNKLAPEQRAWLEKQIALAGDQRDEQT